MAVHTGPGKQLQGGPFTGIAQGFGPDLSDMSVSMREGTAAYSRSDLIRYNQGLGDRMRVRSECMADIRSLCRYQRSFCDITLMGDRTRGWPIAICDLGRPMYKQDLRRIFA